MKLKCLIIDDDPMICDLVKHYCTKINEIDYCIIANTGADGLQLLSNQEFDLLFLDYHLPDMTGHSILEIKSKTLPVIMITSEKEFAVISYDYDEIIDFLVKPLQFERFQKAVHRLKEPESASKSLVSANQDICYIKDGTKYIKTNYKDILYLKAEENYVSFICTDKTILSLVPLKSVETNLPSYFMRVHRSFIINVEKVDSTSLEEIKIGTHSIPISQKYKKEFFEFLQSKTNFKPLKS